MYRNRWSLLYLLVLSQINLQFSEGRAAVQKCGTQIFGNKIIGGNNTGIDEYPWTAILRYRHKEKNNESWGCGGTYIGGQTIITAAHCVDFASNRDLGELIYVRLGEYDTESEIDCVEEDGQQDCATKPLDFTVRSIIIHPERRDRSKENDIALVILNDKPPYTDFIRPICLPDITDSTIYNDSLFVAGWGWTIGFYRSPSNIKQDLEIDTVSYEVCRKQYTGTSINENSQICAGGHNGKNACRGDSGGPLMHAKDTVKWQLVGVVSFGPNICAITGVDGKAAVFTKIQHFIPWIQNNAL